MGIEPFALGRCRACNSLLTQVFVDLGSSPIANAMRKPDAVGEEKIYPLRTYVCSDCKLVQTQDVLAADAHFHDSYTYFSSYSASWLKHAEAYADAMTARYGFDADSLVVEVASNDGYLLQYFRRKGIPVLGVDPAANCAAVAEKERGVPTLTRFFGAQTAGDMVRGHGHADLIVCNNVLAHVPDINDFVAGLKILLKFGGRITIEFPHLLRLIEANYFDTIYHEHYSYLSLTALERLLVKHGLRVFDIDELKTHGGSLRVYVEHAASGSASSEALKQFRAREAAAGLARVDAYLAFPAKVMAAKRALLKTLIAIKEEGRSIVAYGAAAKGNTLLNYCGIRHDFIDYAVDASPHKQGMLLPGTGIEVHAPQRVFETRPDYLMILPWNLKDEIMAQMAGIRQWGGKFLIPLPEPQILA